MSPEPQVLVTEQGKVILSFERPAQISGRWPRLALRDLASVPFEGPVASWHLRKTGTPGSLQHSCEGVHPPRHSDHSSVLAPSDAQPRPRLRLLFDELERSEAGQACRICIPYMTMGRPNSGSWNLYPKQQVCAISGSPGKLVSSIVE